MVFVARGEAPAVIALGRRGSAFGLPPCDAAAQPPDLVDNVDAVGGLGVLGPDVQVEMAAQAARREGLAAEGAVLILCRLELRLAGGVGRGRLGFGHGDSAGQDRRGRRLELVASGSYGMAVSTDSQRQQEGMGMASTATGSTKDKRGPIGAASKRSTAEQSYSMEAVWRAKLPLSRSRGSSGA